MNSAGRLMRAMVGWRSIVGGRSLVLTRWCGVGVGGTVGSVRRGGAGGGGRRRRRRTDGDADGDGDGMRWVGSDHLRSIGVRVDPSRVVGVRGCAGMCVRVCVHEGGGSRAASAESTIENRNRSRCRRLGLSCLSLPLQAGAELSPARVPVCEPADGWGPARLPASFY